jgi:hypothetical protein
VKPRYLIRNRLTDEFVAVPTASDAIAFLWGKLASEWDVWRRCELTSHDGFEIRAELERGEGTVSPKASGGER